MQMEELLEPDEREVLRRTIEKKYAPDTELDEATDAKAVWISGQTSVPV